MVRGDASGRRTAIETLLRPCGPEGHELGAGSTGEVVHVGRREHPTVRRTHRSTHGVDAVQIRAGVGVGVDRALARAMSSSSSGVRSRASMGSTLAAVRRRAQVDQSVFPAALAGIDHYHVLRGTPFWVNPRPSASPAGSRGRSTVGSAPALQAGGRGFESHRLHPQKSSSERCGRPSGPPFSSPGGLHRASIARAGPFESVQRSVKGR
jgi:hypothetical protein